MRNGESSNGVTQQSQDAGAIETMPDGAQHCATLTLDTANTHLVRLAAVLAGSTEQDIRMALADAVHIINPVWVEELMLQTYLFAGFPRSLNALREWRRISGRPAPLHDEGQDFDGALWTTRGVATCETVYGRFYKQLRENIEALHPAIDSWMIVEGYGKVLSRPELELWQRELCIVAACAVGGHDRQLHSHLYGSLHAGATVAQITATLHALRDLLLPDASARYLALWSRVRDAWLCS